MAKFSKIKENFMKSFYFFFILITIGFSLPSDSLGNNQNSIFFEKNLVSDC